MLRFRRVEEEVRAPGSTSSSSTASLGPRAFSESATLLPAPRSPTPSSTMGKGRGIPGKKLPQKGGKQQGIREMPSRPQGPSPSCSLSELPVPTRRYLRKPWKMEKLRNEIASLLQKNKTPLEIRLMLEVEVSTAGAIEKWRIYDKE